MGTWEVILNMSFFTHFVKVLFTGNDIITYSVIATQVLTNIVLTHQGSSAGRHIVYKRNASVNQGKGGGIYAGAIVASISLHIHI